MKNSPGSMIGGIGLTTWVREGGHALGDVGRGSFIRLDRKCADRLLDPFTADDDRPRRRGLPVLAALAARQDPFLGGELHRVALAGSGRLEARQRAVVVTPGRGDGEAAPLTVPEVRRDAIGAGRPEGDLEQLIEGRVGVVAARHGADRCQEEGVGSQGQPIVHESEGWSIEHAIDGRSSRNRADPPVYSRP